jgi:hypothetical protein
MSSQAPHPTTNRFPHRTSNPHNRRRLRHLMNGRRHFMREHRFSTNFERHRARIWTTGRREGGVTPSLLLLRVLLIILSILLALMWWISLVMWGITSFMLGIYLSVLVVARRLRLWRGELGLVNRSRGRGCCSCGSDIYTFIFLWSAPAPEYDKDAYYCRSACRSNADACPGTCR